MIFGRWRYQPSHHWATRPHPEKDIMVTPEYARAYINEITQLAQPRDSARQRVSIARLLRRLSR